MKGSMMAAKEKDSRTAWLSALAAFVSAITALAALWVTYQQGDKNERRARATEERILEAERQVHASKVVFHVDEASGPEVSKEVLGGVQVVANFGAFPIEDVSIEEPATTDILGTETKTITRFRLGTIGPCERAVVRTHQPVNGYAVFKDINGVTWSRKPGEMPVRGRLAEGKEIREGAQFESELIKNCSR